MVLFFEIVFFFLGGGGGGVGVTPNPCEPRLQESCEKKLFGKVWYGSLIRQTLVRHDPIGTLLLMGSTKEEQ